MIISSIIWNADPEIFSVGPITVRWYGLLFAFSFIAGFYLLLWMFKSENLKKDWVDKIFIYVMVGCIVGARLGHVFFYDWGFYSKNPLEIIKIWRGGLASHGAAIGIITALWLFSGIVSKRSILWILDRVVLTIAVSGICIRIGNLINSEIYGIGTDLPWGFIFVINNETVPKHPTQIYEALSCLLIFGLLMYMYWKTKAKDKLGLLFGVFLTTLFVSRFFIEFLKYRQSDLIEEGMMLNMGQLLSIPFILAGLFFIFWRPKLKITVQPEEDEQHDEDPGI